VSAGVDKLGAGGSGPKSDMSDAPDLRTAWSESQGLFLVAVLFSVFVNLLMLTGPLYLLLVHDSVLASRSEPTLVALTVLVTGLFLAMGLIDHARSRLMAVVGARFQDRLDRRIFSLALRRSGAGQLDPAVATAERDLDSIRVFLASPVLLALVDLPWTPLFLGAIFVFHPMLGWLAFAGGLLLIGAATLNQALSRGLQAEAGLASNRADRVADQLKSEAEVIRALGMADVGIERWLSARRAALVKGVALASMAGDFGTLTRTFRLFLQSAMLGLGALLALRGELSPGAMIAASILMGRALAPIDVAVGQWTIAQRAQAGWHRLAGFLATAPDMRPRTALPRPPSLLEVTTLGVRPPGATGTGLRGIDFRLEPGQALGVIGPSGAGKSTLARALTGIWGPLAGSVRLGGASLDQYDPDVLGRLIGYLPQRVSLFDGTVAENIARFDPAADSAGIVMAARKADAHDMIVRLADGYDTRLTAPGAQLSGGQLQRIGLARALYGNPVLLILDEPNANLDTTGSEALNSAIRGLKAEGTAILVMTHRPSALHECDLVLVLEDGRSKAFGGRNQVLREQLRNHAEVLRPGSGEAA
jgi:ATP-binding cassette, subfamily C, bacterial